MLTKVDRAKLTRPQEMVRPGKSPHLFIIVYIHTHTCMEQLLFQSHEFERKKGYMRGLGEEREGEMI